MPIASLHCPRPIRHRLTVAPRDHDRRDRAIDAFEAQRYEEAARETLAYLLPTVAIPDLRHEPLCFVQGSARVHVRVEANELWVDTTLAALTPASHSTAALRYFLTRLSATGQLFQPRLNGEVVSLEFRERLSLLHPLKLIEVLQRLPMEADRNDGWMCEQFGVETPDREPVAALQADELERMQALWDGHWASMDELVAHSRRRRSIRFLDTLSSLAINHLRYTLPLFGAVRARLNESAEDFTNADEEPNKRESSLVKCIKDMRQVTREELLQCVGHASYAINPLPDGKPSLLSSTLGHSQRVQSADELRAAGHSMEAALELIALYVSLLAHHSWPADIEAELRAGLDLASDKPWREVTEVLLKHAHATSRSHGRDNDRDDEPYRPDSAADDEGPITYSNDRAEPRA